MEEFRTERVAVMVTKEMRDRIDQMARTRDGRPSASAVVYDILVDFFAEADRDDSDADYEPRHEQVPVA